MKINGTNFSLAFLLNMLSPFFVFAADAGSLGIRGFDMGERQAYILKQEQALGEFTLKEGGSGSRLVFEGNVFGESALIVYSFRNQRLAGMRYVWQISPKNVLFAEGIKGLLARKYRPVLSKVLPSSKGEVLYWLYGGKEEAPALLAELEILPSEDPQSLEALNTIILEFRAPDPDAALMKKILKEDI